MSRDIAADLLADIQAGVSYPRLLYEGQFRNATTLAVEYLRLWSGQGELAWDGHTWYGTGVLGIEGIEETTEKRSVGFKVRLNGIALANRAIALDADKSQNLPGTIWLAAENRATGLLKADPYLARSGWLNITRIADQGLTCTISAEYEDENVRLLVPDNRRYTTEDQAIDHPGDRGFEQVPELQDKLIAA